MHAHRYYKNELSQRPKQKKPIPKRPRAEGHGVVQTVEYALLTPLTPMIRMTMMTPLSIVTCTQVSGEIVGRRRLLFLCFDEFQLNDIGDAVILKGLMSQLFAAGVRLTNTHAHTHTYAYTYT